MRRRWRRAASEQTEQSQQGEQPLPEPELDNIPDVVAVVNDREISGEVFVESYEAQASSLPCSHK